MKLPIIKKSKNSFFDFSEEKLLNIIYFLDFLEILVFIPRKVPVLIPKAKTIIAIIPFSGLSSFTMLYRTSKLTIVKTKEVETAGKILSLATKRQLRVTKKSWQIPAM